MFESITLKINKYSNPLDIGYLAECILFYDKVYLLIDKDSLIDLFRKCGVESIKILIERGNLILSIRRNMLASSMVDNDLYSVNLFSSSNPNFEFNVFNDVFLKFYERKGKARRSANQFLDISSAYSYNKRVLQDIQNTLGDRSFVRKVILRLLSDLSLDKEIIGTEWNYDFIWEDQGSYRFQSNLDLGRIKEISSKEGFGFDFSPGAMLLFLAESIGDIHISSDNNSEIFTTPISHRIVEQKFNSILNRARMSHEEIEQFQKVALPEYKNLGNVINEGSKSYFDLIKLLEKAEKFRTWKSSLNSEETFIEEYSKALGKNSWFDSLPNKVGRFVIIEGVGLTCDFLGAGGIGSMTALTISAADAFLFEKMVRNWKPSQFIKGSYNKFISGR